MYNPIVKRLLNNKSKLEFLDESINPLYEADEDEEDEDTRADDEYKALNAEDEEQDDSQAPVQGNPDDFPTTKSTPKSFTPPEDTEDTEEPQVEDSPKEESEEDAQEYENPLDNQYAVKFTLGSDVSLRFEGAKNKDVREGVVDGYDAEGFYRVKWSDGTTTNGLTDIALDELVYKKAKVEECVCGSSKFVNEGKSLICDKCGRKINESKEDPLMLADKSRPKGKRMIRSEAHPVSTAVKPSIAEAIRNAMKGNKINEADDIEEEDVFSRLRDELSNEFWTREDEMIRDIEELGYTVEDSNKEYLIVSSDEDEENVYQVFIGGTSRTMTLDFDRSRVI